MWSDNLSPLFALKGGPAVYQTRERRRSDTRECKEQGQGSLHNLTTEHTFPIAAKASTLRRIRYVGLGLDCHCDFLSRSSWHQPYKAARHQPFASSIIMRTRAAAYRESQGRQPNLIVSSEIMDEIVRHCVDDHYVHSKSR
jgi:hypothetical protein